MDTAKWRVLSTQGMEPLGAYHADGVVVWCLDRRCRKAFEACLGMVGWKTDDLVQIAGGAHDLALDRVAGSTEYVLGQIEVAVREHSASDVLIMVHHGCAMYRGRIEAGVDEAEFLAGQLRIARIRVLRRLEGEGIGFSGSVRMVRVGFDGTHELSV